MLSDEAELRMQLAPLLLPVDALADDVIGVCESLLEKVVELYNELHRASWSAQFVMFSLAEGFRRLRGVQLLAAGGMHRECNVLTRTMLENYFRCCAAAGDLDPTKWTAPRPNGVALREAVALYFLFIHPAHEMRRFLEAAERFRADHPDLEKPPSGTGGEAPCDRIFAQLEQEGWQAWRDMRRPSVKKLAEGAGELHCYDTMYAKLSDDVHLNSLVDNVRSDPLGEYGDMIFHLPDASDVKDVFKLAISITLDIAARVCKRFDIDGEEHLSPLEKRLQTL